MASPTSSFATGEKYKPPLRGVVIRTLQKLEASSRVSKTSCHRLTMTKWIFRFECLRFLLWAMYLPYFVVAHSQQVHLANEVFLLATIAILILAFPAGLIPAIASSIFATGADLLIAGLISWLVWLAMLGYFYYRVHRTRVSEIDHG
jgi:hypothetical protein